MRGERIRTLAEEKALLAEIDAARAAAKESGAGAGGRR
jgi:hypothetical protein